MSEGATEKECEFVCECVRACVCEREREREREREERRAGGRAGGRKGGNMCVPGGPAGEREEGREGICVPKFDSEGGRWKKEAGV
jgi:hypothetical protein